MAVPAEMTSRDFSGKFVQNKALSEKEQDILKMQGVGWAMRKTISLAVPHLAIKHYTDAAGVEHIEVEQTVPGLRSNSEHRVLDWSQQKVDGPIFGALVTQNRRVQADELEPGWLKDGLCPETFVDGAIVHTLAQSDSQKDRETWSDHADLGLRTHWRRQEIRSARVSCWLNGRSRSSTLGLQRAHFDRTTSVLRTLRFLSPHEPPGALHKQCRL